MPNGPLATHVGFDSLPNQLVNKSVSQGFCFNILCMGETGLGKSTHDPTLGMNKAKYLQARWVLAVAWDAQRPSTC